MRALENKIQLYTPNIHKNDHQNEEEEDEEEKNSTHIYSNFNRISLGIFFSPSQLGLESQSQSLADPVAPTGTL